MARLDAGLVYGSLETLDQSANAVLISQAGYVLRPAVDMALYRHWLVTMESQLRFLKYVSPLRATLSQDSGMNTSLNAGIHWRTNAFELGVQLGLNESTYVSGSPATNFASVQNLMQPFGAARFAYNGRFRHYYIRLEASYSRDLAASTDRSSLSASGGSRIEVQTQFGYGKTRDWLRFTAGFSIQNAETSFGRQKGVQIMMGISLGNVWGQQIPLYF